MRPWHPLLLLACSALPLVAADPPTFAPPKSWEKVAAGGSPQTAVSVHDRYTVWTDKVLVEATARNRAQSFTETLFRLKTGDKAPEQLEQVVTTHGTFALLGPDGEVASGTFADCRTLYLPGLRPIPMPKDVRYAAHQWTKDGLVCTGERYVKKAGQYELTVLRLPIDRAKNELGEPTVLRPWLPVGGDGFSPDFAHGRVFARGNFVALTGTVPYPERTKRPGYTKPFTQVWDIKGGKAAWQDEVTVEAADDTHAYWFPTPDTVARRPLDGSGSVEQLALPKGTIRLDVQPPKLLALVKREKELVLTRIDLSTGDRSEYDLRAPGGKPAFGFAGGSSTRSFIVNVEPELRVPVGLDAARGEVRAVWENAVYRIPEGKATKPDAKPKWEKAGG